MGVLMRRLQINLDTLGKGVIVLSLWDVGKIALLLFLGDQKVINVDRSQFSGEVWTLILVILWVLIGIFVILHVIVGLCARAEARGRSKNPAYLVLAGALALLYAVGIVLEVAALLAQFDGGISGWITVVIDVCSLVIMLELTITGFRLKRLMRRLAVEEGPGHEF